MPLPDVTLVCDGGQFELNCTITGRFLNLTIIPNQNQSQLSPMRHYLTHTVQNQSFEYGGSTIMFVILSHSMEMTTYGTVISPVNSHFDGTKVECTDFLDQESSTTIITSTVIRVVNPPQGIIIISYIDIKVSTPYAPIKGQI